MFYFSIMRTIEQPASNPKQSYITFYPYLCSENETNVCTLWKK